MFFCKEIVSHFREMQTLIIKIRIRQKSEYFKTVYLVISSLLRNVDISY